MSEVSLRTAQSVLDRFARHAGLEHHNMTDGPTQGLDHLAVDAGSAGCHEEPWVACKCGMRWLPTEQALSTFPDGADVVRAAMMVVRYRHAVDRAVDAGLFLDEASRVRHQAERRAREIMEDAGPPPGVPATLRTATGRHEAPARTDVVVLDRALVHVLARVVREREAWGGASGVFTAEERELMVRFANQVLPC